jgi:RNA polymerase sigma factor (sigma-70 family)
VTIRSNGGVRRQLGTLFNLGIIAELSDGQLLERFATLDGEAAELAFAALVERHGPMVLRVCRGALRESNDVQDAFQATFLVLVQKARSLWVQDSLGPWLHLVAHRVATRVRVSAARRQKHERLAADTKQTLISQPVEWDDRFVLLHEEIERLPKRYRSLLVLCDLQGLTHEKAARHLGWPVGTVKSRLAKARVLLRGRLSRRGLPSVTVLLLAEKELDAAFHAVEAMLSDTLVGSTVQAAARSAAGQALTIGMISTRVAGLIREVLMSLFLSKLKMASVVVLLIGAAGAAGVLAQQRVGSTGNPQANVPRQPGSAEPRVPPGADWPSATAPTYIRQSRGMIITRLEEETALARLRLERTLRRIGSPQDPAVVHARKTFQDLQQRLDRIDQVLVDVVETYPTIFDFSDGPADVASGVQPASGPIHKTHDEGSSLSAEASDQYGRSQAEDRADWAKRMFDRGYISKSQLDSELVNTKKSKDRSQMGRALGEIGREGQQPAKPGESASQGQKSPDRRTSSSGQSSAQEPKEPDRRNSSSGQSKDQQQGVGPDQVHADPF